MYEGQKVAAVLAAAGTSSRMGFDKLFHKINGVEVLRLSMQALAHHPYIDEVVVVAGRNIEQVTAMFLAHKPDVPYRVIAGGATRMASAALGVQACHDASLVAVHDAARPYLSQQLITRMIEAGAQTGAAVPGVPVTDTIKVVEDGFVSITPLREKLVAVQTPQVFRKEWYLQALQMVEPGEYAAITDDSMLIERLPGVKVQVVPGEYTNSKLARVEDLKD